MRTTTNWQPGNYGSTVTVPVDSSSEAVELGIYVTPVGGYFLLTSIVDEHTIILMNLGVYLPNQSVVHSINITLPDFVPRGPLVPTGIPLERPTLIIPDNQPSYYINYSNVVLVVPAITGGSLTIGLPGVPGARVVICDPLGNLGGASSNVLSFGSSSPVQVKGSPPSSSFTYGVQYGMLDMTYLSDPTISPTWVVTAQG